MVDSDTRVKAEQVLGEAGAEQAFGALVQWSLWLREGGVVRAYVDAMRSAKRGYAHAAGHQALVHAVCGWLAEDFSLSPHASPEEGRNALIHASHLEHTSFQVRVEELLAAMRHAIKEAPDAGHQQVALMPPARSGPRSKGRL